MTSTSLERDKAPAREDSPICCGRCGHAVSDESQRISIREHHEHRFLNPHGFVFDVGCFRDAPGITLSGEASSDFSWFPPLAWRVAECGSCTAQLGWGFESPAQLLFFGLILNRLRSAGS